MNPRRKFIWQFTPFYLLIGFLVAGMTLLVIRATLRQHVPHSSGVPWLTPENLFWSLACGILAAIAGMGVIIHVGRSIEKTREGARRFAKGDLTFRLDVPPSAEMGGLAETLNDMAAQLDERISTINQQRHEQEAMLGSMVEGVIAIDKQSAILHVNKSAAQLFGSPPEAIIGRSVAEIIRNRDLQQLIGETLATGNPTEGEIRWQGAREFSLQIHCTALLNAGHSGIGALVVLHDITRIRRLESMRRDFVANVSHELKTPLTSIKGFVETLLDGALEQPEEAKRFCTIIARQVDRLQAIIEDLLNLSRIEQESEQGQVALKSGLLLEALNAGVLCCTSRAAEKNIAVHVECDPAWTARFNAPLFEQIVVNLVDNAIKYSDAGKSVNIRVTPSDTMWEIRFSDEGYGIDSEHVTRIFERFYRVDKARSRKEGGTGLGLSIVKHIVTSHGGSIRVDSKPGVGSTFTRFAS